MEQCADITGWIVCISGSKEPGRPETPRPILRGVVHGHITHRDGAYVSTTVIKGRIGDLLLTASGRLYRLGEPDPDYEALHPNARQRLLDSKECVALAGACPDCTCPAGLAARTSSEAASMAAA